MCYSGICSHEGSSGDCDLLNPGEECPSQYQPEECQHPHVTVKWKLYAMETRYEPAEYIGKAFCDSCGIEMEPEDIPEESERKEMFV